MNFEHKMNKHNQSEKNNHNFSKFTIFLASIEILRPINGVLGSLSVLIGILNTRINVSIEILMINISLGILTYFFATGSSMAINDYYDIEIDKINRPKRPIPSGKLTLNQAKYIYIITVLLAIFISLFHSMFLDSKFLIVIIVMFFCFIGWFYASIGKKSGFPGNILVSFSLPIGFIYGAILTTSFIPIYIYFFALNCFFGLLAREIIKGCEDTEGDKNEGVKTLAIKFGIRKATYISLVFTLIAIFSYIGIIFTPIINPIFFLIFMIPCVAVLLYAIIKMLNKNLNKKAFNQISLILKIGGFLGLISFIFASISP